MWQVIAQNPQLVIQNLYNQKMPLLHIRDRILEQIFQGYVKCQVSIRHKKFHFLVYFE